ncbi:M20/M25/M40 family metallo-hydrolase [Georgenia sp. SYP-B2076]|uniref:M20/M25/M40 family metallo-hydrolase n=1 Tax=Georgenia sp. SYP-B2076 TaxID=2495881 RepID=UPI00197AAFC3|nr:M20/M25/M40 family metallo-hydrolase [Georgenia sp. SYP-B2076]
MTAGPEGRDPPRGTDTGVDARVGGAATGGAQAGGATRALAGAILVAVVVVAFLSTVALLPMAPRPAYAPADTFSAGRAGVHIDRLAASPRTPGSAAHAQARAYLAGELAGWGWRTEVQDAVGLAEPGGPGTVRVAAVANVVATLPGADPTGTVILAAHYDTVPGSPGAGDDGIGVAAVLEAARALAADDPPRNDVVVLLTDGEEAGLLGAEAFARGVAPGTAVVLNHEARGAGGAPATFRTTSPNGVLLSALSAAPGAAAESLGEAAFALLPNNTDFTAFTAAGMHGLDTAIAAGSAVYHSPLDDAAHLSPASLQQIGETSLALARDLARRDLASLPDGDARTVTTLPWGLLHLPVAQELPLALAALVLALAQVTLLRRRRALTLPRAALGSVAALVAVVAALGVAYGLWKAAVLVDPGQASVVVGEPYRPWPYQVAMVLAALGVVLALYTLLRRSLRPAAFTAGALLLLALLLVVLAVAVPGASPALVLPVLAAALGAVVAAVLPPRRAALRLAAHGAGLVPAAVMLGPGIPTAFDTGLAFGGLMSAFFAAVLALLLLPVIGGLWPVPDRAQERPGAPDEPTARGATGPGRWQTAAVPGAVLALAAASTAVGLLLNREGSTELRQEQVTYALEADTGQAYWASWAAPRTPWARSVLTERPAALEHALPWLDGVPVAHGPAPVADLAAPAAQVVQDVTSDGRRELTLRLVSPRGAPTLGLWVDGASATVRAASVAGRELPVRGSQGDFGFLFRGAPAEGIEVRLDLDQRADAVALRLADLTHDLSAAPALAPPPHGRVLVAPEVSVTTALRY